METTIDEIAPDIFRLSTLVPEVGTGRVLVQPVPRPRRRAVPVPHRDAPAVPAGVGGRRLARAARRPALDLLRPRRGRRVRFDEPVPRRCAQGRGRARWPGGHGLAQRPGRPPATGHGRRRGARHRRPPPALHRHPARAPRLGERPVVRRDDPDPVQRRPVHADRRRSRRHRGRHRRRRARGRGPVPQHVVRPEPRADAATRWPTSSRPRSPSCTARRTAATAPRSFELWPPATRPASPSEPEPRHP